MKNTFIKTVRETENGVSFIVDDDVSNEDFYYKLIWEENSIKLVVGGNEKDVNNFLFSIFFRISIIYIFFK